MLVPLPNSKSFLIKIHKMNFNLTQVPDRNEKPRKNGLTMVMDKGLSVQEVKNLISIGGPYIDIVKLGFGTSFVTPGLKEKIAVYKEHDIPVYFGGTLFEAFLIRNQLDEYIRVIQEYGVNWMEVSDGSINISHADKCRYIEELSKYGTVLSEVGSKDVTNIMPPYKWVELMSTELKAGSAYVIGEARESGTVGIYRDSGEVRQGLVQEILTKIPAEKIIWEAPRKVQQGYFLKLVGCNVNLGNIAPTEVIPLEAMRMGLRSETFRLYLDKETKAKL